MSKVTFMKDFLSPEKCNKLIELYKDKVISSTVVDNNTNMHVLDKSRTSSTYFISENDSIIIEIKEKVSELLNIKKEQIEGIQFLRYLYGEQYHYHHDYIPGNPSNHREYTIILYLNDLNDEDGGKTSFYYYNIKVKPTMGMAILFRNITEDGKLITESLHSGESILKDRIIKYALNIWTKQK